jgi:hypothetical protein
MNPVAAVTGAKSLSMDDLQEKYQSAVAGTMFKQLLKSLRSGTGKVAYLDGGMTEDIFRDRLDDQLSEILATTHGEAFAKPFFDKLSQEMTGRKSLDVTM